jgi:hypothetical protein
MLPSTNLPIYQCYSAGNPADVQPLQLYNELMARDTSQNLNFPIECGTKPGPAVRALPGAAELPPEFDAVIATPLATDPAQRYPSGAALAAATAAALRQIASQPA